MMLLISYKRLLTRLLFLFYFLYATSSPNLFLYGHQFTHVGDHIRWFSHVMNYLLNPRQFTRESKFPNYKNKTLRKCRGGTDDFRRQYYYRLLPMLLYGFYFQVLFFKRVIVPDDNA